MRRVGVAVIGTGFWGENQVRVLRQLDHVCDLIGIFDLNQKRAREVGEKYGVSCFSDMGKLLKEASFEAATICTPTHTHYEVAHQLLQAGRSVLVEKPMTGNKEEAEKLVRDAQHAGRKLLVGFIERFNPGVRLVKEMLAKRQAGEIILMTGRRVSRWPVRIGDVGVVKDTAIHDIDVMRYLLGKDVSMVFAHAGSLKHTFEDYAEIMLRFDHGTTGFIDANWLTPRKVRTLIVTGSEATINLDYISQEIMIEDSEKTVKPIVKWDEPLRLELENYLKTVRDDLEPSPSGRDALEAIRVCDAALESSRDSKVHELVQTDSPVPLQRRAH